MNSFFFFYVEIVILFNDLVKTYDTSKEVYCVMSLEIFKEPFMWFSE